MIYLVSINQIVLKKEKLDFRHGALMEVFKSIFSSNSLKIKEKIINKNNVLWYWVSNNLIQLELVVFDFKSENTIKKNC